MSGCGPGAAATFVSHHPPAPVRSRHATCPIFARRSAPSMTPRSLWTGGRRSRALRAPLPLNEPVLWRLSSLQTMRQPVISLSGIRRSRESAAWAKVSEERMAEQQTGRKVEIMGPGSAGMRTCKNGKGNEPDGFIVAGTRRRQTHGIRSRPESLAVDYSIFGGIYSVFNVNQCPVRTVSIDRGVSQGSGNQGRFIA